MPILVGPFRSEVGFEVLYWLPWLAMLTRRYGIDPARFVVVTRGGAGVWYGVGSSVDLFELRTPAEVRVANRLERTATGMLKQWRLTAFDRDVLAEVRRRFGLGRRVPVLAPSWMYHGLARYWLGFRGLEWLSRHLLFGPLPVPAVPEGVSLPPVFVAARFYARATWPVSELTAIVARETLRQLAAHQPVMLLTSGLHADDHLDYAADLPNVLRLDQLIPSMPPATNLAIQSAVLARATAFVGTYGGTAQLALRYGKPVVGFYTDWGGTALQHRHLSEALALKLGVPFHALRVLDIPPLREVLPPIEIKMPPQVRGTSLAREAAVV